MILRNRIWSRLTIAITVAATMVLASHAYAQSSTCDTPYADHGVSEATIVYGIDRVIPSGEGPFLPMDADRNTHEYRSRAFDFFAERFGVTFDANVSGDQVAVDSSGRTALMQPIKTGLGATHQVYAIDAQNIPQWRHRIPLTDVALFDDGYFVFAGNDGFEVNGTYGGQDGVLLPAGTIFLLGEYRMFDGDGEHMDTLRYFSSIPAFSVIDPGAENLTQQVTISCDVESDIFGSGQVRALGSLTFLPDGSTDLDFRYTLRFPTRMADAQLANPVCRPIKALGQ